MQTLLFRPNDILFFKDGRPMMGSSSGKGDSFPMPHVIHSALLGALHRSGSDFGHSHTLKDRNKQSISEKREQKFGALTNAGPFPVLHEAGQKEWYFPTPGDLLKCNTRASLLPVDIPLGSSSLPKTLKPVISQIEASKDKAKPWMSAKAWEHYLAGSKTEEGYADNRTFFVTENSVGIGMNPETGTTEEGQIFSSSRIRLADNARLGTCAELPHSHLETETPDALARLFDQESNLVVGGERRICEVENLPFGPIPFPKGADIQGKYVKYILLTPAIFPHLEASEGKTVCNPGGWLPNWIEETNHGFEVRLKPRIERNGGSRSAWRKEIQNADFIAAKLSAAITPRPIVITGWSVAQDPPESDRQRGGAKSTLLAVPAGAVYYFEAENVVEARKLADVLNWHGPNSKGNKIMNRRSTLMGEKGYGIGVCTNWTPA